MISKKKKRKFIITWEFQRISIVIFLVLCLVFLMETMFVFWDNEINNDNNWVNEFQDNTDSILYSNNTRWGDDGHYTILDQMPDFKRWHITICDSDELTSCITIMDRNLWATSINGSGAYWYHYQWWNNYWFELWCWTNGCSDDVTRNSTWTLAVRSSDYNNKWYYWTSFILWSGGSKYDYWSDNTPWDHNWLWWWENDNQSNNWWLDLNNSMDRQWPCPEWYHVPSAWEQWKLVEYLASSNSNLTFTGTSPLYNLQGFFAWAMLRGVFNMPAAAERIYANGNIWRLGAYSYVWSSSPNGMYAYGREIEQYEVYVHSFGHRADGYSVRCFRDEPFSSQFSLRVSVFDENWINELWSWEIISWSTIPQNWLNILLDYMNSRTWYTLSWWYDPDLNIRWSVNEPITKELNMYAIRQNIIYNIMFDSNWWTTIKSITWYYDTVISEPNKPTKSWQVFGWRYKDEWLIEKWDFENDKIVDDMVLYAKWEECWDWYIAKDNECLRYYNVVFNTDWWTEIAPIIVFSGDTVTNPWIPAKPNYLFRWWYNNEDLMGEKFDFENTIITWDVVLYAKWDACPEWYKSINNRCVANSAWVYYESWVIKITNWETIIYIKDRNQWAEKSLLDSENFKAQQLIEKIDFEIWKLSCQNDAEWCPENTYLDIINRILNKNFENIAEAGSYLHELENASYDSEDDISPYYWTFYFWWNNNWATYNELHVNRNEWIIDELVYLRWFDEWKIGEDNTWWWEWENDNPCDISKWEYLPTMSDWKEAFDIWWEINWMEKKYEEWEYIPILFFNDILALNWYFTTKPWHHCQRQMCYENNNRNLLTLLFSTPVYAYEDKRIVFYWNFSLWWTDSNILEWGLQKFSQSDTDTLNAIAAPVRCFIKSYTVRFDTDWGSEIDDIEIVWNQPIQVPNQPTKPYYTFKWWYTDSAFTQEYDFSEPVTSEMVLYAKWEKIKTTWWTQLKRDNCPGGDYSNSYYDWDCGSNPKEENNQQHNSSEEVIYDTLVFNPHYSDEQNQAYQYAYHYWITTKAPISNANIDWNLTRIAMAKMLSQYAINVLWMKPDTSRNNTFKDVTDKLDWEYDDWVTLAYQLWIMWINMPNNEFRPNDLVPRAEFVTALSRLLYKTPDWMFEETPRYYIPHMEKLIYEWIISNPDPKMLELRWYVMLMLMRSDK